MKRYSRLGLILMICLLLVGLIRGPIAPSAEALDVGRPARTVSSELLDGPALCDFDGGGSNAG